MAASLVMPPELWRDTLELFWGVRDPHELRELWNYTRLVSKHFKSAIERIFMEEHIQKTKLVFAISVKKGVPANVYTTNVGYVSCNVGNNKRLRNHTFTLELQLAGLTPENSDRAIFRKRAWLENAHTYDYWGQTFNCTKEQSSGGSYSANEAWIYPKPKHVEFKGSLDQVISNIDTIGGAFLIKVRKNGMFANNCLIPDLKVAAYHGEVSLDWKVLFSILFKELEAGQQIRERPKSCTSIGKMI